MLPYIPCEILGHAFGKRIVKFEHDTGIGFLFLGQKRSVVIRYGQRNVRLPDVFGSLHDVLQMRLLVQFVCLLFIGFGGRQTSGERRFEAV